MKTKEELNEIKEEVEKLDKKLHELTEEELEQVTGGVGGVKPGAGIVHENLEICAAKDTCFCLDVNKDTVMK